jgi:hypothetical protein
MKVHWKDKWMSFVHNDTQVTLQGLVPQLAECSVIDGGQLQHLQKNDELWSILQLYAVGPEESKDNTEWPADISQLTSQFSALFEEPKELPPKRPYDRSIPFISGAQPFRLLP